MARSAAGGKIAAKRISRAIRIASLSAALVSWAVCAMAQEAPPNAADQPPANPHAGGFWERDVLTGDWGGARTDWENRGVQLGANYIGELLGNPVGGVRRGAIYEGRLELLINLDLEKLAGWSGATVHANAYQIHGRGLSANDLGNNLLLASGIEAERSIRLFDLWLEQQLLDGLLSIRAGQLAADDEFVVSQYASVFVNSTFGFPGILATDLPSGGPEYPLSTPGVRIKLAPTSQLSLLAAVFNGDPAGPGPGSPQSRDPSGTAFRVNDDAFAIAEAAYAINQAKDATGLPGTYKIGGWYHSGRFADQRFDSAGRSLADPGSSGIPALHRGDYGFYAVMDQMAWRSPGTEDRGLGVFLRLSGSPSDRNQVAFYADGGINCKGLLPERGADVLGLGLAYARIGDAARGLDLDTRFFSGSSRPVRDYEMAIELTYRAQVTPWWTVQPDLQVILHPGGHVPDPTGPSGTRPIRDAVVAGVRTTIAF
jgi:porin